MCVCVCVCAPGYPLKYVCASECVYKSRQIECLSQHWIYDILLDDEAINHRSGLTSLEGVTQGILLLWVHLCTSGCLHDDAAWYFSPAPVDSHLLPPPSLHTLRHKDTNCGNQR